jgi:hypothetical protein
MALNYVSPKDVIKSEDWNYMADVSNDIPIDQTKNRTKDTVYQNTTGHKLLVSIIVNGNNPASYGNADVSTSAYISSDNVDFIEISSFQDHHDIYFGYWETFYCKWTHSFIVPDGYYYKITGNISIIKWYEQYIW